MSINIVMPKAGLTMIEGTIGDWLVDEGSTVKKGDVIMEYENEKNVIEYESLDEGIIHLIASVGDTVAVGELIAVLAKNQDEYNSIAKSQPEVNVSQPNEKALSPTIGVDASNTVEDNQLLIDDGHVRASGLARKLAKESKINLKDILYLKSSAFARIMANDVTEYIKEMASKTTLESVSDENEITAIPWTGVKKAIANNMMRSLQTSAQCTATCEIDATDLLSFRERLVSNADYIGTKVTVNDLLCMAICKVVEKNPILNGTFENDTFYMSKQVNLSVAVATENGLMVPVLRNAGRYSVQELSKRIKDIAVRAKDKKLSPEEQSGGTLTISNVGMFPIDTSTPILNTPEVAIYGFGRPVKKVAVMANGEFKARDMFTAYITFDHRVIDGLVVGRQFKDLKFLIENPELIIL